MWRTNYKQFMSLPKCLPNKILQLIFEDTKNFSSNMNIKNYNKIIKRFQDDAEFDITNIEQFLETNNLIEIKKNTQIHLIPEKFNLMFTQA